MIALAIIASWWFLQTQQTAPCWERPVANDKTYMTMNAAPESLTQTPTEVKLTDGQIEYFWSKVNKTDSCWIWIGCLDHYGYGSVGFTINGVSKKYKSHRISVLLTTGCRSIEGHVLHKCDVPACVNPDHLFIGNQDDNMKDMASKWRSRHGREHHNSVLTEEDIPAIKKMGLSGKSQGEIGKVFGVCATQIGKILRGKSWRHVASQKPSPFSAVKSDSRA